MMFAALSSAYIIRQSAGNWLEFPLPSLFYVSSGIIIISSVTLHFCLSAFKAGNESRYKSLLVVTLILGFAFVISQFQAWNTMFESGLPLTGNPSPSFVYVLTGLHAAHVLGGIVALLLAIIQGFYLPMVPTLRRINRLRLTTTYWHFMGFLWIYLLLFLILQQ